MPHSGSSFLAYAFPLSPEKRLLSSKTDSFLYERVGWGVPSAPTPPDPRCRNIYCNLQIHYPSTRFFFRVSGECFGVGRSSKGRSMESLRIHLAAHFFVSSRNATLNEEHCVTKHKTAAKTESRFHYHWSGSFYNILCLKIHNYIVLVKALFDVKKFTRPSSSFEYGWYGDRM